MRELRVACGNIEVKNFVLLAFAAAFNIIII